MKLYYDRKSYTISFNTNGGSSISDITQKFGTAVTKPNSDPTKTDYVFAGWYSDAALNNAYTFSTMPAANIIIFARWVEKTEIGYKVDHYQQNTACNGYVLKDTDELTGFAYTTVTAAPKTYEGFTCNSSVSGTVSSGTVTAGGNLVLKLYYDRNISSISFESNGGSIVDDRIGAYGTQVVKPNDPLKTGVTFGGWYSDAELKNAYTFTTMPATSIKLYAKWITTYKLYIGGVQVTSDNMGNITGEQIAGTVSYDPATDTLTMNNATITGGGSTNVSFGIMQRDGRCLTMKVIGSNKITLADNTNVSEMSGIYKDEFCPITIEGDSTASLDITVGGVSTVSGSKTSGICTMGDVIVKGGVTVTATAGNSGANSIGVFHFYQIASTLGGSIAKLYVIDNSVLRMYGGTGDAVTFSMGFYNDHPNTSSAYRMITYLSNGGKIIAFGKQAFWGTISGAARVYTGANADGSGAALYTGAIEDGWGTSVQYIMAEAAAPAGYKVEHYKQNTAGTGYEQLPETENLTGLSYSNVTASAKTYDGFNYNNSAAGTVSSGDIAADGSLVLKLYYDRKSSTISFNSNGGDSVTAISGLYGASVSKPGDPAKTGATFGGWYSDEALSNTYTFTTMPAADITLYAKWIVKYEIYVGGVQVTSDNKSNITGSYITGKISYNPDNRTLTLDNATITGGGSTGVNNCIFNRDDLPLTIQVIGANKIEMLDNTSIEGYTLVGINKDGKQLLTITGDSSASLNIKAGGVLPGGKRQIHGPLAYGKPDSHRRSQGYCEKRSWSKPQCRLLGGHRQQYRRKCSKRICAGGIWRQCGDNQQGLLV